jgi:hypothetical protein
MYYIANEHNQIVAADQDFLDLLNIDELTQLYGLFANGKVSIDSKDSDLIKITINSIEHQYIKSQVRLNSLLGELYLIDLKLQEQQEQQDNMSLDSDDLSLLPLDEEISIENDNTTDTTTHDLENQDSEADSLEITDELFDNLLDEPKQEDVSNVETKSEEIEVSDDDILDLFGDNDIVADTTTDDKVVDKQEDNKELFNVIQEESKEELEVEQDSLLDTDTQELEKEEKQEPIALDIAKLSSIIGISEDDYRAFLQEYIETALSIKDDLNSQDEDKFNSAISTISHLSKVLHIDIINEILERLEHSDSLSREIIVQELYDTLNRLSIDNESIIAQVAKDNDIEVTTEVVEESLTKEEPMTQEEPSREEPIIVTEDTKEQSLTSHKIDLSDVKPIHFDFSMEEAANDLSLPVDLIEEFVHDFIEQAHEETEKMLTAYDEGDLERVNKIGHLLKGTSSNLRIVPLADTLYKIQFCENLDELEPLIKDYWGHFLAFENYIKLRTN